MDKQRERKNPRFCSITKRRKEKVPFACQEKEAYCEVAVVRGPGKGD